MKSCSKAIAFAILACSVAFATVLKFDAMDTSNHFLAEMKAFMDFVSTPATLSRYIPAKVYESMGFDPSSRLMAYKWDNCGNPKTENLIIRSIVFAPDPITFPGTFSVSFDLSLNTTVPKNLQASVTLAKKVGESYIKLPCIGNIGSCTYQDICVFLNEIAQCPPEFQEAGIPCHCPLQKGSYHLPKASFEVDASFLPPGDYHIRANLSMGSVDGGCYDIFASFG